MTARWMTLTEVEGEEDEEEPTAAAAAVATKTATLTAERAIPARGSIALLFTGTCCLIIAQ